MLGNTLHGLGRIGLIIGALFLVATKAEGQCVFDHSPWGVVELSHPEYLREIKHVYPGEYLEVYLRAEQCYRIVVLDTFNRQLELVVSDSSTFILGRSITEPAAATTLNWYATSNASALFWFSQSDCSQPWEPFTLLMEWTKSGTDCSNPPGLWWDKHLVERNQSVLQTDSP